MPRLRPFTPIFTKDLKYGTQARPGILLGILNGTASPGAINVAVVVPQATVVVPISPDDISNLWGWWDAADTATITDTAGVVTQIDDKSGNARHFVDGTSGPITNSRTQNGLNVLDFTGGWLTQSANVGFPDPLTVFVVYVQDTTPGSPFIRSIVYANGAGG
jgi:hypothetical protein